jgi:TolB-like protein
MRNVVKKMWFLPFLVMVLVGCGSSPKAEAPSGQGKSLDTAIQEASEDIEAKLDQGIKVALLNFSSTSEPFSQYVLDELSANLVNSGKLVIVDRQEIDLIRSETNFQLSGEVSDESAQKIGRMLGAQSIVSGSLANIGDTYRINIKVITVQSAAIAVQYRSDIANDSKVQALLSSGGGAAGTQTAQAGNTGGNTTSPAQSGAATAQPPSGSRQQPAPIQVERQPAAPAQAGPQSGTYTFYPRIQATRGGLEISSYLDRIVVRGNYLNVYVTSRAEGRGSSSSVYQDASWGNALLQDLDNPSKIYNKSNSVEQDGFAVVTYEKVTARRFRLYIRDGNRPETVFEEIILGQPE